MPIAMHVRWRGPAQIALFSALDDLAPNLTSHLDIQNASHSTRCTSLTLRSSGVCPRTALQARHVNVSTRDCQI